MTTEQPTTTGVATIPVEDIKTIIASAPNALLMNNNSLAKATEAGLQLLEKAEAEGMNEDLDAEMNGYLVIIDKTLEACESRRKPTTGFFDSVKKMFTEIENKLDRKKEGTLAFRIQSMRDKFAKEQLAKKAEEERLLRLKEATEREKIECVDIVTKQLNEWFIDGITRVKNYLNTTLNESTLDTIDDRVDQLMRFSTVLPETKFIEWNPSVSFKLISQEEVNAIVMTEKELLIADFRVKYSSEIAKHLDEVKDKIAGKRIELDKAEEERLDNIRKAAAAKSEAERKKILADQQLKEDNDRKAKEAQELLEKKALDDKAAADKIAADNIANLSKQAAQATATFNTVAANAAPSVNVAKGRTNVKIKIHAPQAFQLIIAKWWTNEGSKMTVEQLEKKLDFMIKSCEKDTLKTGEIIDAPKLMSYEDDFTTKVKKN